MSDYERERAERHASVRMERLLLKYDREPETMSSDERFLIEQWRAMSADMTRMAGYYIDAAREIQTIDAELHTHQQIVDTMLERDLGLVRIAGTPPDESLPTSGEGTEGTDG